MSGGGGGGLTSVLPVAAGLAATVLTDGAAAGDLAPMLEGTALEGAAGTIAGAGIGGLTSGATAALTGQNVGQNALMGGIGGGLLGYGGLYSGSPSAVPNLLSAQAQAAQDLLPSASQQATGALSLATPAGGTGVEGGTLGTLTPQQVSQGVASGVYTPEQASAYGQSLTNAYSTMPNVPASGLMGSGITGTQAMLGLGGLGLYSAINNQNKKYGTIPSSTVNAVPADLNYAPNLPARPMNLTPTYADGGQVDQQSLNGGPVPQKLMDNATGQNMMFPQPGVHSSHFTNPTNTPTPGNILTTATDTSVDPYTGQQLFAAGGIAGLNAFAGGGNLGGYSDGGQYLQGPGDGMSDSIPAHIDGKQPARLADSEFVIPADVVSHLGNGSSDAGAKKLYSMMDKVRMARTGRKSQGKEINADKYLPT